MATEATPRRRTSARKATDAQSEDPGCRGEEEKDEVAWHAAIDNLKPVEVAWLIVNATLLIPPEDLEAVLFEGRLDRERRVAASHDQHLRPPSRGG